MQFAYFCYHRKDDNMLETCINSLRQVSPDCGILVVTDGIPPEEKSFLADRFGVLWIVVSPSEMVKQRAACKIRMLKSIVSTRLEDGDELLVSDVDVYFQKNPFTAFAEHPNMDLGLTTRGYNYLFPINGGIFYIRVNSKMRDWVSWYNEEFSCATWKEYVDLRMSYNHFRYGLDWGAQDFLIACWNHRKHLLSSKGLVIEDVGPNYNYCPPTDTMGNAAFALIRKALAEQSVCTIHLKSDLKQMIYDKGLFPNALIRHPRGSTQWL